ncbi:MAG: class I SAM-dependent methyltransferase [Candidatus Acidiferrales bacterium]
MTTALEPTNVTPERIFETLNAYHKTAALKTAIELDVFSAIADGATTRAAIAKRCQASERGIRILCDYLTINGFLLKNGQEYSLADDSAVFLNRRSPAYMGAAANFLALPEMINLYQDLTAIVRAGTSLKGEQSTAAPDSSKWVEFARSMSNLQRMTAVAVAETLCASAGEKWKVLDVAAGHGMYGVMIAKQNPNAEIFALDWPEVLKVAHENAQAAGVAARHHHMPGSAFEVNFGKDYDIVLLTGFLHHFDPQTIETLLRKVHAALKPGGRAVTVEFVPNEDRVSPPAPAAFSMIMLGTTRAGDAYPYSEYDKMFRNAGFTLNELRRSPGPQSFIISKK